MRSFTISRVFDRHTRAVAAAVGLLLATLTPALAPVFASAAQLTERSVALSSATKGETATYNFTFTQATNAGAVVIQFCTNTPLIGEYCTAPGGMVVTGATAGAGVTSIDSKTGSTIKLTKPGATDDLTITGITNPSAAGTVYARILTYTDDTAADAYNVDADTNKAIGTPIDQGSVAFAITDAVAVSGDVLEALTFCVSGSNLTGTDCATGYSAPILTLGKNVGNGVIALDPSERSERDVFTKISTNAIGGAVVSLKSTAGVDQPGNVPCAGLALYGTGACNIVAAGTTGTFAANTAKFGVKLTLPVDNSTDGTIGVEDNYDTDDYRLDGAAAIGTYGDTLYNTSGGSANNLNTKLTFAASSTAATPAGRYSANISLIATGTF